MTKTIIEALKTCATTTTLIDLPVRYGVTIYAGLPHTYAQVSFVAEFSTCVIKSIIPACEDNLLCDTIQGATAYTARATTLEQDVLARAALGVANKLAYASFGTEHAVKIEAAEMGAVAVIKNIVLDTQENIMTNVGLGATVGAAILGCLNYIALPVLDLLDKKIVFDVIQDDINICASGEFLNTTTHEDL